MPDNAARQRRLTHLPFLSSDELITLLEENVEDFAIIVTNAERQIINWSKGAEHIFGYSVEEVLGKDIAFIFTSEDRDHSVPAQEFQTALKRGRAMDERYHLRKDGSLFWASGVLTALREDNGQVRGTVKILRDLTERKQLEETLRQQTETAHQERKRAEASAREVEHLNTRLRCAMAEAHHRIKNSFQMLLALLELQSEKETEVSAQTNDQKLFHHIRSMSAIHDLLTNEAKTAANFDAMEARNLLERLLRLIQETLVGRSIQADIQNMALSLRQVMSLAPLLNEIVTNAIKYGRGDIQVTLKRENDTARLEITDDGPGFPEGFDPYTAAQTGLELIETLVRHDFDGEVLYENAAAGGACVKVTFRLAAA